jgi:hypothetical protein
VVLVLVLAVALVAAGAYLAQVVSRQDQGPPPGPAAGVASGPGPLKLVAAHDYNPLGDAPEHAEEAPKAIDGDVQTVWYTQTYQQQFPRLKEGTGIYVDLGSSQRITGVKVTSPDHGWAVQIRYTDSATAPGKPGDWKQAATATDGQSTVAFDAQARLVLVWITQLPQVSDGFRMRIAEIEVTGA